MIDYDKMRTKRMKLHKVLIVPEKPEPHYSWQWVAAMSGDGGVIPDAVYWRQKYDELMEENLALKKILHHNRDSQNIREEKENDL